MIHIAKITHMHEIKANIRGSGHERRRLCCCLSYVLPGFGLGLITKLGIKNSYTISIEASVHNTILAFLVAGTLMNSKDMVKHALVYAMFSFWTALIYSFIINRLIEKGTRSGCSCFRGIVR